MRLLDAGADLADLNCGGQRLLLGLAAWRKDTLAEVLPDEFRRAFTHSFGTANPERMHVPFWEAMIRSGDCAYAARRRFEEPCGPVAGPVWCANRYGQSLTLLSDGRAVQIGGEHEDHYDPDFCIYNDVFVHGPAGQIEIYGYPREVFPPTDFHTATLVGDRIFILGCLGYPDDRRPGHTPVYVLDLSSFRMTPFPTTGEAPGWVFGHKARSDPDGAITIRGGEVFEERDGERRSRRNVEEFALNTRSGVWRRLTARDWQQYAIHQENHGLFVLEHNPAPERLYPSSIEHTPEPCEDRDGIRFSIRGVPVSVTVSVGAIEIIIEGKLPDEVSERVAEEVRTNVEAAIKQPCVLQRV
jgi:hypothetical protein